MKLKFLLALLLTAPLLAGCLERGQPPMVNASGDDDALIDDLARDSIAYVPYFPLGGFTPLQSSSLDAVAARLGATPMQVALAWLLRRSPNILLIPGTSSVAHLRENLAAATLALPDDAIKELEQVASIVAA